MIVISFDGLGTKDLQIVKEFPHFRRFFSEAAIVPSVKTVYPSQTYAAHSSISTGKLPARHGVINNTMPTPRYMTSANWYWYRRLLKGKTFYDIAREKGLKTGAFLWPVTGGAKIDYHVPEIFQNRFWRNQIWLSLHNGSKKLQLELMPRFGKWLLHGTAQPYLDTFVHKSAMYTMLKYRPDLLLLHYCDLDHLRHDHGRESEEAMEALKRHDERLGEWMDYLDAAGPSTIVVLGDHYSLNVSGAIRLNSFLARKGFLKISGSPNRVYRYTVLAHPAGGSCYLYLNSKEKGRKDQYAYLLQGMLEAFSRENDHCLEKIYTAEEAAQMGADPDCLLMAEAKEGYYFQAEIDGPEVMKWTEKTRPAGAEGATHGYSPEKTDYTTVFAIRTHDPSGHELDHHVKPGTYNMDASLIDEGPTLAHLLGGELPEADGRVLKELFETEQPN
ncbi:MAG: alkaline phosphatase family protein [Firmicutes bacterium]|nr:alkaline phosphatase family protein [Bacillota bacterium]